MVIFLLAFQSSPAWSLLWLLLVALVPMLVFASALAVFLAAVNVYMRGHPTSRRGAGRRSLVLGLSDRLLVSEHRGRSPQEPRAHLGVLPEPDYPRSS